MGDLEALTAAIDVLDGDRERTRADEDAARVLRELRRRIAEASRHRSYPMPPDELLAL